jgi:hypothetical protein
MSKSKTLIQTTSKVEGAIQKTTYESHEAKRSRAAKIA